MKATATLWAACACWAFAFGVAMGSVIAFVLDVDAVGFGLLVGAVLGQLRAICLMWRASAQQEVGIQLVIDLTPPPMPDWLK